MAETSAIDGHRSYCLAEENPGNGDGRDFKRPTS